MIKCRVKTAASVKMPKENGGEYVLHNCVILEGPDEGSMIPVSRTTKNAEGVEKSVFQVGDVITAYPTIIVGRDGEEIAFFEGQGQQTVTLTEAAKIAKRYATANVEEQASVEAE